jgi:hypothetical protein
VIAEHGDDRNGARAQILGEDFRLARAAGVGEVAAQDERVGFARYLGEQLSA